MDVPLVVQDLDRLVHHEPEVQNAVRPIGNNEDERLKTGNFEIMIRWVRKIETKDGIS